LALVSCFTTFVFTPFIRRFAIKTKAITAPRARDIHKTPIPRLGGLALLIGFLFAIFVSFQLEFLQPLFFSDDFSIFTICLGGIGIGIVGALDDYFDLNWFLKFSFQIMIALWTAFMGVRLISLPIFGTTLTSIRTSYVLTVIVIVGVMNAINFIDGLDGLAVGICGIAFLAFFLYCYLLSRDLISYYNASALICIIMFGTCVGFLPYNFNPARIFLGDCGSMLMGYLLACSTIIVTGRINVQTTGLDSLPIYMPIILPFSILAFPFVDMMISIIRRLIHKKSPFQPDQGHIHHQFLLLGHSQKTAVIILYFWTFLFAFGSLAFLLFNQLYVALILIILFIILLSITFLPAIVRSILRRSNLKFRSNLKP